MTRVLHTWFEMPKRPREYEKPTIVRFLSHHKQFDWEPEPRVLFAIVGTDYGYVHTAGGDVRTWRSYSGARRFLRGYSPL